LCKFVCILPLLLLFNVYLFDIHILYIKLKKNRNDIVFVFLNMYYVGLLVSSDSRCSSTYSNNLIGRYYIWQIFLKKV
jgi:hypothetical protein